MNTKNLVEKFVYFVNNLYFCKRTFVVKCKNDIINDNPRTNEKYGKYTEFVK